MAHAVFSASGSNRWLHCPGSIQLSEKVIKLVGPTASSIYAMEGTAAHWLADTCVSAKLTTCAEWKGKLLKVDEAGKVKVYHSSSKDPFPHGMPKGIFLVDDDMIEAVDVYIEVVNALRAEMPDAEEMIEARLDLSWIRPDMFGTGDYLIANWMDKIVVVDYKHGKGVPVEVENNPQLKYYALGAAKLYDFEFDEVMMVVVQPRCPHEDGPVRTWTTSMKELRKFEKELGEGVDRALEDDPMLVAGEHCKFCPALGIPGMCTASEQKVIEMAKADFAIEPTEETEALPVPTTPEQLQKALMWVPLIDAWCKKVQGFAEDMALRGEKVPGYKLVEKRSNRKWNDFTDESEIVEELTTSFGLEVSDLYEPPKFKGPAKIEKMLTAAKKRSLADTGLIVKPSGAPTLVKESDPRAELILQVNNEAQEDFKNLTEE